MSLRCKLRKDFVCCVWNFTKIRSLNLNVKAPSGIAAPAGTSSCQPVFVAIALVVFLEIISIQLLYLIISSGVAMPKYSHIEKQIISLKSLAFYFSFMSHLEHYIDFLKLRVSRSHSV